MLKVPFADPAAEYHSLKQEIDAAVLRVLDSGTYVFGEELEAFESAFAGYCGVKYAIGVGSGTAALVIALKACGIESGDEVITVANSDLPTVSAISHAGGTIVWSDINPRDFNLDVALLEEKINSRTRAILPVHMHGHPADMAPILEIARRHNLFVIEDAALAVGARYRGRRVGGFGLAAAFSLAPSKLLGCIGDAGVITTDDEVIATACRIWRNYGQDMAVGEKQSAPGAKPYLKLMVEGYNERLDSIQAAVLCAKLPTHEQRLAARRAVAARYDTLLADLDLELCYEQPWAVHGYRAYTILVDERDQVRDHLNSRGIAARPFYVPPMHLQPVYQHLGCGPGSLPVTEAVARRTLSLPCFPQMTEEQIQAVAAALHECVPPR